MARGVRIGRRKHRRMLHRVDIEFLPETQALSGQIESNWKSLKENVPCHVETVAGGERFRGVFIEAGMTTLVEFRFRTDLHAKMRLKYGSRYLYIAHARDPEELGRRIVCQCTETEVL